MAVSGPFGALVQYNIWAIKKLQELVGGGGREDSFEQPPARIEDNRTIINYGAPNARDQMRSPSGRKDPSTGR